MLTRFLCCASGLVFFLTVATHAQDPNTQATLKTQQEKMASLAMMDGTWRGDAWMFTPQGQRVEITQTERVGPMLNGTIRVVEGRGYDADGNVPFNAFGIISYDVAAKKYMMRSYAQGRQGDFEVEVQTNGFSWSMAMGNATIRYQATIENGKWTEVGERIVGNQAPFKFLEMNLSRIGDCTWPAEDAVPPK